MSTHNIGFYEEISKLSLNYHQISSNTHLISSADKTDAAYFAFCYPYLPSQNHTCERMRSRDHKLQNEATTKTLNINELVKEGKN